MAETLFDGKAIRAASLIRHVEIHDEIDSTNNRAAQLAQDATIQLPALVVARCQIAGRGRGQNVWESAGGALTFSILLQPLSLGIGTSNWPQLSLATAVAVCDALAEELKAKAAKNDLANGAASLRVKWPNDVMLNDRKVCGILIESPAATSRRDQLVIGIGININNSWQGKPAEVSANRIALCDASDGRHDLQQTLLRVLSTLQKRLNEIAIQAPTLPRDWQRLCWLRGKRIEVSDVGRTIAGACEGIAEDGRIVVRNPLEHHRLLSGSVRLLE